MGCPHKNILILKVLQYYCHTQLITNNRPNLHSGLKMYLYLTCTSVDVLICSTVPFHSDFCEKLQRIIIFIHCLNKRQQKCRKILKPLKGIMSREMYQNVKIRDYRVFLDFLPTPVPQN